MEKFSSLADHADTFIYAEGGDVWTVKDILAHLWVVETTFLDLFMKISVGEAGAPEGFDVDAFNHENWLANKSADFALLLGSFSEARNYMKEFVATLTSKKLARIGRHPFLGVTDLGQMIKLLSVHAQTHVRDIQKKMAGY